MAILWEHSLQPWTDINGDPYAGAKAYFFDANTTTPKIVYKDYQLSNPHDWPVVANSGGMFPAVFIPEQTIYRLRITTSDDVTLWDVDGISAPTIVPPDPPSGDVPAEKLWQTGDLKFAWRTSAPTGFVRGNGRTIGAPSSGATERANDDCQALFIHLWEQSPNTVLPVSGGRGATSAGDWAANKTITLPDFRGVPILGLLGMGNAVSTIIPSDLFTGGATGDVLGDRVGVAKHQLTMGQMPKHQHSGNTDNAGGFTITGLPDNPVGAQGGPGYLTSSGRNQTVPPHQHTFTTNQLGNDEAHPNVQPSIFTPVFVKL